MRSYLAWNIFVVCCLISVGVLSLSIYLYFFEIFGTGGKKKFLPNRLRLLFKSGNNSKKNSGQNQADGQKFWHRHSSSLKALRPLIKVSSLRGRCKRRQTDIKINNFAGKSLINMSVWRQFTSKLLKSILYPKHNA